MVTGVQSAFFPSSNKRIDLRLIRYLCLAPNQDLYKYVWFIVIHKQVRRALIDFVQDITVELYEQCAGNA